MLLAQAADAQALLLDHLGSLEALLLLVLVGLARRLFRADQLEVVGLHVPLVFGGHMQLGRLDRLGRLVLDQHAEVVALGGVADQQQVVLCRRQARIPQVHLVPGHRALTAAGQANRSGAEVGTAAGTLGQMAQGDVPATVGFPLDAEIDVEEHRRLDQQTRVDQHEGSAHLLIGELGQVDHPIEQGLELRVEHFLADAAFIEEHHGLHNLWLFLQAHRLPSHRHSGPALDGSEQFLRGLTHQPRMTPTFMAESLGEKHRRAM
ncbi:hypothetical protein D3C78_1045770 [compost metagenome]